LEAKLVTRVDYKTGIVGGIKYISVAIFVIILALIPTLISEFYIRILATAVNTVLLIATLRFHISIFTGLVPVRKIGKIREYPFVSIIVPAYNEEKVLERNIKSMLELDYPKGKIEFIYVYEDKCTDRTEEIILNFASRDKRIKPIKRRAQNGGKAAATNYGLKFAKGEIIGSFDADHSLEPDAVKRAVYWLQNKKVACVKGRCRTINKDESFLARLAGTERDIIERIEIYSRYIIGGFSTFGGGHAFFKKSIFKKIGLFDEDIMTEDIDFSVKIHEAGYDIVVDPYIVSWEETPSTLTQWWHQRKRWSRGWMQVAVRHLGKTILSKKLTPMKKFDTAISLAYTVLPIFTTLFYPIMGLNLLGYTRGSFYPDECMPFFIALAVFTPIVSVGSTWALDIKKGERMRWNEIPCLILMVPYTIIHSFVSWAAFTDEFIIKKKPEYVKTIRTGVVTMDTLPA